MMPAKHPLSVLLVNAEPEEIKIIATSLREFFPGCRVEAVYTSDEALQSSLTTDWDLFLVDQTLAPRDGIAILADLRRNNPHAAIMLQSDHSNSGSAIQALRQGADFILFKNSPSFLTDLLSYAQEAIEKRALEVKLEQTFQRHLRLVESVSDVVYELDQEGRFIYVSPSITPLLGYAPEELAGQHFSMLLSPAEDSLARYRMNERRTGTRSIRAFALMILGKAPAAGEARKVLVHLTAKGLYDGRGRYLGTMGTLRDVSHEHQQTGKLQELEHRLQEADRQLAATQQATLTSQHLQQPLSALLQDSHRLLATLQGVQIEQHLRQLATYASQASELSQEVWRSIQFKGHPIGPVSVNTEAHQVITDLVRERSLSPDMIEQRYAQALPSLAGNARDLRQLLRILFEYALHSLTASPAGWGLLIETYALKTAGDAPAWVSMPASVPFSHYIVLVIRHSTERAPFPSLPMMPPVAGSEFLRAHDLVRQYGGAIEIRSAFTPGFQITLRFPAIFSRPPQAPGSDPHPTPPAAPTEHQLPPDGGASQGIVLSGQVERRRSPRIPLNVSVELTIGTSICQSTALDIGFGGMLLVLVHPAPPIEQQPVYLILRTSISFLELQGTVHPRSTMSGRALLVITFSPLSATEEAILLSFTQSLQEPSTTHRIEVLIAEGTSRHTPVSSEPIGFKERRWHVRTRSGTQHPVAIHSAAEASSISGMIVNAGKGGVCIRLVEAPAQRASPSGFPSDPSSGRNRVLLIGEPRLGQLPGRIVWGPTRTLSGNAWHMGICFEDLPPTAEEQLNRLLAPQLLADLRSATVSQSPGPLTSLHFLPDRHGRVIALSHDRLTEATHDCPVIIISPGYAQTRLEYLGLAYALARHGYRILRYDSTHTCGLGDGEARLMTMQTMREGLEAVMSFAATTWPKAPMIILASDLSARIALRVAAQRRGPAMLLLIDPVLDLAHDLIRLHHRDLAADVQEGRRYGIINLLGLPIDADAFLLGATLDGYMEPSSTGHDIEQIQCQVCLLRTPPESRSSGYPIQPESASITQAMEALGSRGGSLALPAALSSPDPILSERQQQAIPQILDYCATLMLHGAIDGANVENMDHKAAHAQHRLELEQLRTHPRAAPPDRTRLLTQFIAHSRNLCEIHSYLQVYDQMYQSLHRADMPSDILEVGCGHYGFARLWWLNEFYKLWSAPRREPRRIRYIGLDIHPESVTSARDAFATIQQYTGMVFAGVPASQHPISTAWIVGKMAALPLGGECVDSIVCHFALNFVDNPLILLRELYRLLRADGTLVVSALTPCTDLGALYRRHLHDTQEDALSSTHRQALLELAVLHESLRCSRLPGFSRATLNGLFGQVSAHPVMISPSLEGQILIAMVRKLDSARRI